MIALGYLYKTVRSRPAWIANIHVIDLYSVSCHASSDFADYITAWRHNGYWLFDNPSVMQDIALDMNISLSRCKLFYYEAYEFQYDGCMWTGFQAEASFGVNVEIPVDRQLEGYNRPVAKVVDGFVAEVCRAGPCVRTA